MISNGKPSDCLDWIARAWLLTGWVVALVGAAAGVYYFQSTLWPREPVGEMHSWEVVAATLAISFCGAGLVFGVVALRYGVRRSPRVFKLGAFLIILSAAVFIILGVRSFYAQREREQFAQYSRLDKAELERLADQGNDRAASDALAVRSLKEKAEIYRQKSCAELQRLWDTQMDSWAFDELEKRRVRYLAEQEKYQLMSDEELTRREAEGDNSVWFERRARSEQKTGGKSQN